MVLEVKILLISKIKILVPPNRYIKINKNLIEQHNIKLTLLPAIKWTKEIILEHDVIFPFNIGTTIKCFENFHITDKFFVASEKAVRLCNDKLELNNFLISNNFDCVPEMNTAKTPLIIKPRISTNSAGIRIILGNKPFDIDVNEFTQAYEMGKYEYSTNVIFTDKILYTKTRCIDYSKYRLDFRKNSRELINERLLNDTETPYQVIDFINKVFPLLNYKGLASIDYTIINNKLVLFEINPWIGIKEDLENIFKVISNVNN